MGMGPLWGWAFVASLGGLPPASSIAWAFRIVDFRSVSWQPAAPRRRRNTLQHVATRFKSAVWSGKPKIRGAAARSSVRQYVQNHNMLYFEYGRMQRTCAPPHTRASARMHARTRNQQCARARSLAHVRARARMSSRLVLPLRTPVSWIRFDSAHSCACRADPRAAGESRACDARTRSGRFSAQVSWQSPAQSTRALSHARSRTSSTRVGGACRVQRGVLHIVCDAARVRRVI